MDLELMIPKIYSKNSSVFTYLWKEKYRVLFLSLNNLRKHPSTAMKVVLLGDLSYKKQLFQVQVCRDAGVHA